MSQAVFYKGNASSEVQEGGKKTKGGNRLAGVTVCLRILRWLQVGTRNPHDLPLDVMMLLFLEGWVTVLEKQ